MFCANCGAQIADEAVVCVKCGVSVAKSNGPTMNGDQNAALRLIVPVGRSGWAITSGYLGLLSLLPFFGVFAVITGILALKDIKKHPDKHGKGRAWFGIIIGSLATLVYLLMMVSAIACD